MTIITIVPTSGGPIIAADGAATNSFEGPFWRFEKLRLQHTTRVIFEMGTGVVQEFTPSTGQLVTNFSPGIAFSANLPGKATLDANDIELAANTCGAELWKRQFDPVYGQNICTIGVLDFSELIIVRFDYHAGRNVAFNVDHMPLTRSLVFGPTEFVSKRWQELLTNSEFKYFLPGGLPLDQRDQLNTQSAIKSFLRAARQIAYKEKREVPISNLYDCYLIRRDSVERLANGELF